MINENDTNCAVLTNKLTIDELDEIANGLGTKIINYMEKTLPPAEHYKIISDFEKQLLDLKLSTNDIFLNKGPDYVKGRTLSEQFSYARENLEEFLIVEDRF